MKGKIFSSLSLFLLLGGTMCATGVTPDNDNNVVFSNKEVDSNGVANDAQIDANVLDLSVYNATSNTNTITLSEGVQYAKINGGVYVGNLKKVSFIFNGALAGKSQTLNFGSTTSDVSQVIQTEVGGEIVFDFAKDRSYSLYSDSATNSILNNGRLTFNITESVSLDFGCGNVVNKTGGIVNFEISKDVSIFSSKQSSIITESGAKTTINFLQASYFQPITWNEMNIESSGQTTLQLVGSYVLMGAPKMSGKSGDKSGLSVVLAGKSSMALGGGTIQDVGFVFRDGGNTIYSHGASEHITWLDNTDSKSNYIALADWGFSYGVPDEYAYRNDFRVLEIGISGDKSGASGISGDALNFIVYANLDAKGQKVGDNNLPAYQNNIPIIDNDKAPTIGGQDLQDTYAYSDRVIIHSSQGNKGGVHNLGVVFNKWDRENLSSIAYNGGDVKTKGNIAVATVANASNVTLNTLSGSLLGFNLIETSFEKVKTNEKGILVGDSVLDNDAYTTYFLSSARDVGVTSATQEVTSSVFSLNYDLFLANFNSLNKRMGDLRDNPYSQGAWGRIFNGQLSNDFGLGSQNNYTTLQAGYDYDFGLENARNYLGVAFSYGFSISEMSSNAKDALQSREIKDIFSNSIELALYNVYVSDNGFYSDSIAKFSYLMSDFNLTNNGTTESLGVNNYALSLSEEVGYVFTLGESKEWSITPQAELGLGYYSSSDLTQVAGEFYLDAKADSLLMFRARVGSMVGYDFKQFTQGKDIQASLYAGLSYEFDYLNGGDIELTPNVGNKTLTNSALSSDSRGVLNIGTNLAIKENTRLYVDFQTSFGGKINTDYQINIGARFSFGEKSHSAVRANNIANPPIVPSQPQQQETNTANKK